MNEPLSDDVLRIAAKLQALRPGQLLRVESMVDSMVGGAVYALDQASDFVTVEFCLEFGDLLLQHHNASAQAFTKDKFEYGMVTVLGNLGVLATKSNAGNPGNDITVQGIPWSLKTQADANIKESEIHISKFMELGKGQWETEADLVGLRDAMFRHMQKYDRIFTLRCLSRAPSSAGTAYVYELVEIPKTLLLEAANATVEMRHDSKQSPKPGYCRVWDTDTGRLKFELYFDGGTERKLQVRKLAKQHCTVHATWTFTVPS